MKLRIYDGTDATPLEAQHEAEVPEEHLLGQYIPLHYHYAMLQDEDRVGAFRYGIDRVVRPGMHVLELGGGTGILSSFAARRGARVTCVERNPALVRTARRLIDQNGLGDSVTVVQQDALAYLPEEPVDVVVCEMLHVALIKEKQLAVIRSFKRRYQRAFGGTLPRFLPEATIAMVQPVDQSFDFAGYWAPIPMFQAPAIETAGTRPLAALRAYAHIDYGQAYESEFDWSDTFPIEHSGTCNALRFVTQNVLAIDVAAQRAITWPNQCLVLPLESPIEVHAGQHLRIGCRYKAGATLEDLHGSMHATPHAATHHRNRAA